MRDVAPEPCDGSGDGGGMDVEGALRCRGRDLRMMSRHKCCDSEIPPWCTENTGGEIAFPNIVDQVRLKELAYNDISLNCESSDAATAATE